MMHVRTSTTLTYAGARAALDAAFAKATDLGLALNIAVCDGAGTLLAFARMDGAFAHSGSIAIDKAATVCGFEGIATDDLYDGLAGEDAVVRGIANRPGIAAFGGGVPIRVGDDLVGAVGVSGGSAQQDKEVASAGAAAVTTKEQR